MNLRQLFGATAVSVGLLFTTATILPVTAFAQYAPGYDNLRSLVDRTQSDLKAAANQEPPGGKGEDRYRDAQKALSDLDRHLAKGHFDKDDMDHSIDKLKDVLDHNTLMASTRDLLMHDLEQLRTARAEMRH